MTDKAAYQHSIEYIQQKMQGILREVTVKDVERLVQSFFDARRIFVYGAGRSGLVSRAFAIRLVHLGFQTFVIGETIGAPVKKNDLVCIVSGSGETIPAVMTADIAHNIGAKLVVITGVKGSRLTKHADITIILTYSCSEKQQKQYAPLGTLFEASAWVFLDSIIAQLMEKKGETEETMQSRHATLELPP